MTGLVPLFLLWLANRSQGPQPPAMPGLPGPPPWPTPSSPPPLPAFHGSATPSPAPSADPSHVSTPLADLHKEPPHLPPASATQPESLKKAIATKAKSSALNMLRGKLRAAAGAPTSTVPVSQLQSILNTHGARLKPDGLYGPKTAAGWSKLAKAKGLPSTISRANAKSAKVSTQAFEALRIPTIP